SFSSLPPTSDEPIRPIDPAAWISHSAALTGAYIAYPGSSSLSTITSSSSVTETERESHTHTHAHTHIYTHTHTHTHTHSHSHTQTHTHSVDLIWDRYVLPGSLC